jgi:hypothetical protein
MRKRHTTIPWGPIVTRETWEGYVAFCKRQRDRLSPIVHKQRRVFVGTVNTGYKNVNR